MDEQKLLKKKSNAIQQHNYQQLAVICGELGSHYQDQGSYENALSNYEMQAKAYGQLSRPMEKGKSYRMMGEMHMLLDDFENALKYVQLYLKLAKQESNTIEKQRAYATLGRVYLTNAQSVISAGADCDGNDRDDDNDAANNKKSLQHLRNAEKSFLTSLLICKGLTNINQTELLDMQSRLYLNLGITKEYMNEFDESIGFIEKSMTICRKYDFSESLYKCYTTIALLYQNQRFMNKDTSSTLRFLNLALEKAECLENSKVKMCETLLLKSDIFIKMGDFQSAKQVLWKAYKLKTTNGDDREKIENSLKVLVAMCKIEDQLIVTDSTTEYEKMKTFYETLGDGACKLHNYDKSIVYYLKMLEMAELNGDADKLLIPIYISLYQTYKDKREYKLAVDYLWKEFEINKMIPKEAFGSLVNIAECYESMADKDFWDIEHILIRAKDEAKKINNLKMEKNIILKQIGIRKRFKMNSYDLEEQAKSFGIEILNGVVTKQSEDDQGGDDKDDENTGSNNDENTPNIGDDICLEDISDEDDNQIGDDIHNDKSSVGNQQVNDGQRTLRKRQGRSSIAVKKNAKGETQLHQACINGNLNLAKRLIEQGHPVNVRDNAGWLPLHEACNHGYKDIVELLLDRCASINDKGGERCDGITPLHDSCANGNLEIVELLLERGANATLLMDSGETPLDVLRKWRTTGGAASSLNATDQIFYETICQRLSDQLNIAGIRLKTSIDETSLNNSTINNSNLYTRSTKRKNYDSLLKSTNLLNIQSSSNNDTNLKQRKNSVNLSNANSTINNEPVDTIKSIMEKKFPEQQKSNNVQDSPDFDNDFDTIENVPDDNDENHHSDIDEDSEEINYCNIYQRRPNEDARAVTSYKEIMENLRHRHHGNVPTSVCSPQKVTASSTSNVSKDDPGKRTGFLNSHEIGEDWLDDDLGPVKKKQKMLSEPVVYTKKINRPSNYAPTIKQMAVSTTMSPLKNLPHTTSSSNSALKNIQFDSSDSDDDCVINNVIEHNDIDDDDGDNSTDAFNMLMTNRKKLSIENKKRRSRNISENSNETAKQQSSLFDAGFCKFKSSTDHHFPDNDRNTPDSTQYLLIPSPIKMNLSLSNTAPKSMSSMASKFHSVKVKIEEFTVNIPINKELINELTIGWLADEASRRYYNLKGLKPILRITTDDGAIFENTDPINLTFDSPIIGSMVLEWSLPSLAHRYMEACNQINCVPNECIQQKLDSIQSMQKIMINNEMLSSAIVRPLFKAITYQTNLIIINLENNFIEDDGVKYLAQALPTLTQLKQLNLNGNMITAQGLNYINQQFPVIDNMIDDDCVEKMKSTPSKILNQLMELKLSFNPLTNKSLSYLQNICTRLSDNLNTLHLTSCDISDFENYNLNYKNLIDFDISFNKLLNSKSICKILTKLDLTKIVHLNISFLTFKQKTHDVFCDNVMDDNRIGHHIGQTIFNIATQTQINLETTTRTSSHLPQYPFEIFENIKELNLSGCQLNDNDIWKIFTKFSKSTLHHQRIQLEKLCLIENPLLTKRTLEILWEIFSPDSSLTTTTSTSNNNINNNNNTTATSNAMRSIKSRIKYLYLDGCEKIIDFSTIEKNPLIINENLIKQNIFENIIFSLPSTLRNRNFPMHHHHQHHHDNLELENQFASLTTVTADVNYDDDPNHHRFQLIKQFFAIFQQNHFHLCYRTFINKSKILLTIHSIIDSDIHFKGREINIF